jgi:DNA-binding GntR family transcriptional regulator
MTVRQALVALTQEGLIYGRVGKGTFISAPIRRWKRVSHSGRN